jgi:hypothetical protein
VDVQMDDLAELPPDAIKDADIPGTGEMMVQVEKLMASPPLQHSDSNRQLLRFLAEYAWSHPGRPVKEIELATSVYGLSLKTFDPQLDSTVRVKVGRLRSKISEYYAYHGANDHVMLEIPRGAYCLVSHYRKAGKADVEVTTEAISTARPEQETAFPPSDLPVHITQKRPRYFWWIICAVISLALGSCGTYLWMRKVATALPNDQLSRFWRSFYKKDQPVIAVFSNPRLGGRLADGGLHYYEDGNPSDSSDVLNLGYAGAGDVHAVHLLTRLFGRYHWDLNLVSGALLSWDTAKEANLVFIGRPEQNPALHQLPLLHDFYFKYHSGIINAHPQPGESPSYHYSEALDYDYAIIAFIPGFDSQANTLVLAGNTTWGSQAAAECVTKNSCVESLLTRLGVGKRGPIPYFEAVLKVRINNDIPVWSTVVAVRHYTTDYSSWVSAAPDER